MHDGELQEPVAADYEGGRCTCSQDDEVAEAVAGNGASDVHSSEAGTGHCPLYVSKRCCKLPQRPCL